MTSDDVLCDLWRGEEAPERLYALVNHAACPGLLRHLARHPGLRWKSLFDGSKEEQAVDVAPILIDLGPSGRPSREARDLAAWLVRTCRISNALAFIHSTRDHAALAQGLVRRLDARLPDDLPVLLRYFDTRVFEPLLQAFTPVQRSVFLGLGSTWTWLSRAGEVRAHRETEAPVDAWSRVTFTPTQEAQLIEAAEPDAIAHRLWDCAPDLCHEQAPAELHAKVEELLTAAKRYRIDDTPDQLLFCMTGLQLGSGFHEQADWQRLIVIANEQGHRFEWAVRQWESDVHQ